MKMKTNNITLNISNEKYGTELIIPTNKFGFLKRLLATIFFRSELIFKFEKAIHTNEEIQKEGK